MGSTIATLFVRSDCVTVLVARGRRISKWVEMPLEQGLVKDGLIIDPNVVGVRIHSMLKAERIKTRKMFAAVTGLHCVTQTMVLPHVQKSLLGEAIRREADISLPVPVDQLYLSWEIVAATSEALNVYLAASPKNTVDALLQTMQIAGLKPLMLDFAPLALSRMAVGITGIIADIRPTELDIVVMVDGLPQLVRSQTYPSELGSLQEKLLWVKEELERSIDFYDSAHLDKPLDAAAFSGRLPVHVSGKLMQNLAASQFLAGELNRSVLPFHPTLKAPHNFPAGQFMVNVGLATKALADSAEDFPGINLNLLPNEKRPKGFAYARVGAAVGSVAAATAAVVFSVIQLQDAASASASLKEKVDRANNDLDAKLVYQQTQKTKANDLTKRINILKSELATETGKADALEQISSGLEESRGRLNAQLSLLTTAAEGRITLSSIVLDGAGAAVSGTAADQEEALEYARALRESKVFSSVVVSSLQLGPTTSFTLDLEPKGQG